MSDRDQIKRTAILRKLSAARVLPFRCFIAAVLWLSACSFGDEVALPTTTTVPPPPAIPAVALNIYAGVGKPCPGVDWAVVAAIGKVESDHGRIFGGRLSPDGSVSPIVLGPPLDGSGVGGNITAIEVGEWRGQYGLQGDWMQAVGPMQFLPQSFEIHGEDGNGDGQLDPHNLYDAVAAAANLLCSKPLAEGADPADVILTYNQSREYQSDVVAWAGRYRLGQLQLDS